MKLLLNPWVILAGLLLLGGSVTGGYVWGARNAAALCAASNAKATGKIEKAEDQRDANVDAIGASTSAQVASEVNQNRGSTDESAERIRTVYVRGDCRDVDPGILRELRAARDDANAALGIGVRPVAAGSASADSGHGP